MDNVTADETHDDFQALHEFFSARRGDSELFRRLHKLCDRVRNIATLEQAGEDAQERLQITQGKLREAAAELADLQGHVHETRLRVMLVQTIDEAHARAGQFVADAEQKAREILEAAGREARQREEHLNTSITSKQATHDKLHKAIQEAHALVKTSIPTSERFRR